MHSALLMNEIVRMICEHAKSLQQGESLANLACVQKGLGTIALDVLWENILLSTLLYLFPRDAVISNSEGEMVSLQPLCRDDWSRFIQYAPRIRTLRRDPYFESDIDISYNGFLEALALYRPNIHILPLLEKLEWSAPPSELPKLGIFIVPSIKNICIYDPGSLGDSNAFDSNRVFVPILSGLIDMKTSLHKFCLSPEWCQILVSSRYEAKIVTIFQQSRNLTRVAIRPTRGIMGVLATLPALKYLSLFHIDTLDDDRTTAAAGNDALEPAETLFLVLDSLRIHTISLHGITDLLKGLRCSPRSGIDVECKSCTPSEISAFLDVVVHPVNSPTLQDFSLSDISDIYYNKQQYTLSGHQITLNHIQSLLTCRHLTAFHWFHDYSPLGLVDEDLQKLAVAWPDITVLTINNSIDPHGDQSCVTLRGLAYLSACERLYELQLLMTVPNVTSIESLHIPESSKSPLKTLEVGYSFIGADCTVAVTCFLIEHFPMLKDLYRSTEKPDTIDTARAAGRRWDEVAKGLNSVRGMINHLKSVQ